MCNTVAGRLQFDNSQECIAKKRQWRRHANENTLERNASIVGPLLSNIFMNDMYYCINECQLYGYADDNTLSKAANDVESLTRSLESDAASTLS